MPPTSREEGRPADSWPDEAMIRPPIDVLGEDGVARPLDEDGEGAAPTAATPPAGGICWLEEAVGAAGLEAVAGAFTTGLSGEPCGPGEVVLGWRNRALTEHSRVTVSVAGDLPATGQEPPLVVTQVRPQAGALLVHVVVGGHRPVRPRLDVLVVDP